MASSSNAAYFKCRTGGNADTTGATRLGYCIGTLLQIHSADHRFAGKVYATQAFGAIAAIENPHRYYGSDVGAGLGDNPCDKIDNAQSKPAPANQWVKAAFVQS